MTQAFRGPGATGSQFQPQVADARNYPRAAVPLLAQPSLKEWRWGRSPAHESAFLTRGGESYTKGRYALADALRRSGAAAGATVLLPAFHCRAMVEPAIFVGAAPRYYPVTATLQPDYSALHRIVSGAQAPAAMVLPHYFGFPNSLEEADQFCRHHGIALIEDCAHALYGRTEANLLGTVGSYAIASLWKFLPVRDGALLLDNTTQDWKLSSRPRRLAEEIRALGAIMEAWAARIWRSASQPPGKLSPCPASSRPATPDQAPPLIRPGLAEFVPEWADAQALRTSLILAAASDHDRVIERRRSHYASWLSAMKGLPGARPLFDQLPEGVVPYAFPLVVDEAGSVFHRLKSAGVPLWRWEDMAVTDCDTAQNYRLRLLQLPCHQGLRSNELEWLIHVVHTTISAGAS